jgi:hypothetical protein
LTSQPLGTNAYTLASLTVTGSRPLPDGQVEQVTDEGVLLRRDGQGRLVDLWAQSSTTGDSRVALETLRETSRRFVDEAAPGADSRWTLETEEELFHLEGERLVRFTWRSDGATQQIVEVEVDRRTGAVTYLGRATAPRVSTEEATVTAARAQAIALEQSAPDTRVVNVLPHTWGGRSWLVSTERAGHGAAPTLQKLLIDATTGELVHRSTT